MTWRWPPPLSTSWRWGRPPLPRPLRRRRSKRPAGPAQTTFCGVYFCCAATIEQKKFSRVSLFWVVVVFFSFPEWSWFLLSMQICFSVLSRSFEWKQLDSRENAGQPPTWIFDSPFWRGLSAPSLSCLSCALLYAHTCRHIWWGHEERLPQVAIWTKGTGTNLCRCPGAGAVGF